MVGFLSGPPNCSYKPNLGYILEYEILVLIALSYIDETWEVIAEDCINRLELSGTLCGYC
jgi:hypothetical protein